MSVDDLAPAIRRILTDPTTKWNAVSVKEVRTRLTSGEEPVTTADFLLANKQAVFDLVCKIFDEIDAERKAAAANQAEPVLDATKALSDLTLLDK
ncbi:hypothetical protein EXIGLDRAFT_775731 [Exidia glandulosa HHB12029]|uniref:Uncharacterized protein n=1 Tax=Exidia glandulosa HHB12029 TaxID=1314781 RepID=A0A165DT88_EXIGL|nr:hypothetical protein EXIGLDRAFT_775731 [Exidia glandulosa HHB12029]